MIPLEVIALSPYAPEWVARHGRRRSGERFRDRLGRTVELDEWRSEDWSALLAMYSSFDPAQRVQGLPPLTEQHQAVWVEKLLGLGPNLVARAGGRIVGHAALVTCDDATSYELVLFVHQDYQRAGVDGALAEAILRLARRPSSEKAVERWAGAIRPIMSGLRVRLRGLAGAIRFASIPAFCALVVALASEEPRGRALALALAVASVCLGLGVHARQIILGRPLRRTVLEQPPMSTGEWMARLR